MSPTERDVSPPQDVWRALARLTAALVGLILLSIGVVWLIDGGTARWPAYLGWTAAAVIPAGLLLAAWSRLHRAAGRRVLARTSWADRDAPHYGWRVEAAIVGALLSLVAIGSAAAVIVLAMDAYERSGWTEVEAEYVQLESQDPTECDGGDCPPRHRLVTTDDVAVFVPIPAKSWPADKELPGVSVTVYAESDDPDALGSVAAEPPIEFAARAFAVLVVGLTVAAGAWTVLAESAGRPEELFPT